MTLRSILVAAAVLAAPAAGAQTAQPVVLELFTSQGCSSCPPADLAVAGAADRADVIALSFNVTYWNHLGWKDTFSRPEFTARQVAYAKALGHDAPFTPEVVAGGRTDAVANTPAKVDALIARGRTQATTMVTASGGKVTVAAGVAPRRGADVWLVRYDPRVIQVPVKAGENGGKTLPQRNVVRSLTRMGGWRGQAATFAAPAADPSLRSVVLVQASDGGPILAAARL
ncbi:MAG: DUF1223 domain-containing protein [Alphaproteobacteria bacterium]|nr:DUF1223 domain-containing protein [Alphaproteobacteria bacterium]MBU1514859.1 DUF1223 domain-containing protein [Alphaproteobacteria bacterium]MBU2093780.1 DUF1223 domain-containing protein [Alphaproteobacteria bacterium]MBU2149401.1 DUF1223 domain-containing protein [Alphaproteobacteria bacterium]MBU2305361.1 DUF1223 domain-containing protein [Alphaproteobacteria bacterium]